MRHTINDIVKIIKLYMVLVRLSICFGVLLKYIRSVIIIRGTSIINAKIILYYSYGIAS